MTTTQGKKPIVVGVDGSESSIDALRRAERFADVLGAPIKAIITWTYPTFGDTYFPAGWSPEADAQLIIDEATKKAFGDTPPADLTTSVREGSPAKILVEASKNAEIVVVGSRGHGGFAGLLLGSVSSAVAAHAHSPVLVVHSSDDEPEAD